MRLRGLSGAETRLFFNAQSSLKWVRPSGKQAACRSRNQKTIKTSFKKWYFPALTDFLIQFSTYSFLTWRDLRRNRKTVPMSCRCTVYFVLWEIRPLIQRINGKFRYLAKLAHTRWQREMSRRLGYPIKQDVRNQDEQPQNHGLDKGQQVLCHVEKEEWPYKIKKEPEAVNG